MCIKSFRDFQVPFHWSLISLFIPQVLTAKLLCGGEGEGVGGGGKYSPKILVVVYVWGS